MEQHSKSGITVADFADVLLDLSETVEQAAGRPKMNADGLKPEDILTLKIVKGRGKIIVGDIQRALCEQLDQMHAGQLSRIIHRLADREQPFISESINPKDKRKNDIQLTVAGQEALARDRASKRDRLAERFRDIEPEVASTQTETVMGLIDLVEQNGTNGHAVNGAHD